MGGSLGSIRELTPSQLSVSLSLGGVGTPEERLRLLSGVYALTHTIVHAHTFALNLRCGGNDRDRVGKCRTVAAELPSRFQSPVGPGELGTVEGTRRMWGGGGGGDREKCALSGSWSELAIAPTLLLPWPCSGPPLPGSPPETLLG